MFSSFNSHPSSECNMRQRLLWKLLIGHIVPVFAVIALTLAAIGIYGVMSFTVARAASLPLNPNPVGRNTPESDSSISTWFAS